MLAYDRKSVEMFTAPAREMFEAWISFFPTAPLFGVPWRFAPDFTFFAAEVKTPAAPKARPKPALVVEAKAEPVETPKPVAPAAPRMPVAEPKAQPKAEPAKAEPAAKAGPVNDGGSVEQIRGIGPRLAAELKEMGITTVAQIAALTKAELTRIDAKLTTIKGRCFRDDWVGQAKALIAAA